MKEEGLSAADNMVLEAIDEVLSILGVNVKKSVYYFAEADYGLTREKTPSNLKKFHEGLHMLFGIGSYTLEKFIRSCLMKKFGVIVPEEKDLDLAEFVSRLKDMYRG